jgi:mannosyltransferase OCH1-like enzyme
MASTANNPVLESMAQKIVSNIQENILTSVYEMTGPTVVDSVAENFNVAVERTRLVCRQGQFTSKIFQYPDNLNGYWVKEQERTQITK